MLPRSHRLSVEQINQIMEKGRVAHSPFFLVRFLTGQKDTRVSAIAPKKIAKTAVGRHRATRAIYAASKTIVDRLNAGVHIAVFAKTNVAPEDADKIKTDLESVFVKAGLLR